MRELIKEMIKILPDTFFYDNLVMDIVEEIHFRIENLPDPEKHIKACINYMIDKGSGEPIGFDLLVDEDDDCVIWDYIE